MLKYLFAPLFVLAACVVATVSLAEPPPKGSPIDLLLPANRQDEPKAKEEPPKVDAKHPRGLKKTPQGVILKHAIKHPFVPAANVQLPPSVTYVPSKLSYWLNNQYGICVCAEECFNQACLNPEVFISDATVKAFAQKHGWLNGAYLKEVMDQMRVKGFEQDNNVYGTGPYLSVSFGDEPTLQAALSLAPVKLGMDADALPAGAGNKNGWYKAGGRNGQYQNEDHCTALCGYGPVASMFAAVGVDKVPADWPAKSTTAYLYFTWSTIGVVDHDFIMSCTSEAYVRNPTATKNGRPQPNPGPGPNPVPPPVPPNPPVPPAPGTGFTGTLTYTNGVLTAVTPGGAVPAPAPNSIDAAVATAGLNPILIAADLAQLFADIKAKKGFAVIMGDLLKLAADAGLSN